MRAFVSIRQAALREAIVKFVDELSTPIPSPTQTAKRPRLRTASAEACRFCVSFLELRVPCKPHVHS